MLSDLRAPDGEAPPVSSVYAPFKVQFAGRSVHGLGFLCPGRSSRDPPGSQTTIPPCIFHAMRFSPWACALEPQFALVAAAGSRDCG